MKMGADYNIMLIHLPIRLVVLCGLLGFGSVTHRNKHDPIKKGWSYTSLEKTYVRGYNGCGLPM